MLKKLWISLAVSTLLLVAGLNLTTNATAQNGNPPGNNGVIKINDEAVSDSIPNNDPHVSCEFRVEFYNYDQGDYRANVNFDLHAPTASDNHSLSVTTGNLNPFIGGDVAGGGTDLDASETYKLTFTGDAHPEQGYHVKVTVTAPGSQGSDKKHKVFWVEPCPPETTPDVLGDTTTLPSVLPNTGGSLLPAIGASLGTAGLAYKLRLRRFKLNA